MKLQATRHGEPVRAASSPFLFFPPLVREAKAIMKFEVRARIFFFTYGLKMQFCPAYLHFRERFSDFLHHILSSSNHFEGSI